MGLNKALLCDKKPEFGKVTFMKNEYAATLKLSVNEEWWDDAQDTFQMCTFHMYGGHWLNMPWPCWMFDSGIPIK